MINCTEVEERVVSIQTAQDGATMKSSHVCMKTYFTRSRAGEIVAISTRAYYVKSLQCDLLAGRALTRAGYRVVLDEDTDISGIYPLDKNGEPQLQNSISFMSEHSGLFYLKTEPIDWTSFDKLNGYDLWHKRMGHCSYRNIRDTIPHSIGLESLKGQTYDEQTECPSCMIGKSKKENVPGPIKRAETPLRRVNFDIVSSSVTSIEGYDHAAVFSDDCSELQWVYGLKTKDEMLNTAEIWWADISDIRGKYEVMVVMRDNGGKNSSKEIKQLFTPKGVKNYFSTAFEPWQDGLAEAAIKSLLMLTRTIMQESGMAGRFWFCAMTFAKDCRNAIFKRRISTTPWEKLHCEKK